MLKSVIWDMDGVLVNSEPVHYRAYVMALEEWNAALDYDEYKTYIGTTNQVIIEGLIRTRKLPVDPDSFNKRMKKYKAYLYEQDGYPAVPGTKETLQSLKKAGYRLAVASSSPYENIVTATKAMGIYEYFDQLVSGESVARPKPAPDVFLKAAKLLKTAPEECLVVEDSCHGVQAAKRAGMACIGFRNPDSGDQDLSSATAIVDGFESVDAACAEQVHADWYRTRPVVTDENIQK